MYKENSRDKSNSSDYSTFFESQTWSLGVILRVRREEIETVMKFFKDNNIHVAVDKISEGHLWIIKKEDK